MKQKINADVRRYVILGACNLRLAHRALSANLDVGLLLPCNVIVHEEDDHVIVAAIDHQLMLSVLKDERALSDVADEAKAKLTRVIESLKS